MVDTMRRFSGQMKDMIECMVEGLTATMHYLGDQVRIWHAIFTGDFGGAAQAFKQYLGDIKKYEYDIPNAPYPKKAPTAGTLSPEQLALAAAEENYRQLILSHASKEQVDAARAQRDALLKAVEAQKQHTDSTNVNKAAIETTSKGLIDLKVSIDATMNALKFMTSSMGNFPLSGVTGSDLTGPGGSLAVREEYDWEGRSSQYGPRGNRLLTGPYVGLNPQEMGKYGVKLGDYVHTQAGWLKVQESASRRGTIEFHADRPGQFESRFSRLNIDAVRRSGQASVNNIYYSPTIQHTGDAGHFAGMLEEHANHIATLVENAHRQAFERSATV
jgi:hypothetical protein